MAAFAKFVAIIFRTLQILGALFNTAVLTYLIVNLSKNNNLNGRALAVEIISAAGLVWAAFIMIFTICLLQKTFFQCFTSLGDGLFFGGFIAVVVLLRDAFSNDCNSTDLTVDWLQRGGPNLGANCQLIRGVFIVSIVLAVLFFLSSLVSWSAHSSAKKDKAFGPSPANGYTSGRGKRNKDTESAAGLAAGPAVLPPTHDGRVSHESKYTDITEKTNDGGYKSTSPTGLNGTGAVGGPGREYLAPRANYAATETTVSPVPSSTNLPYGGSQGRTTHAGQYAMAGALVGGAAAHHHAKNSHGHHDGLPNHPGPEDHTTERIPNEDYVNQPAPVHQQPGHLVAPSAGAYGGYTNTNSMYSELDNTTTTGSTYGTPGAFPGSYPGGTGQYAQPTAFFPAVSTPTELPHGQETSPTNPHYYSHEMEAPQRQYEDYQTTPVADARRDEVGFGYGSGPGRTGGGGNEVDMLPELGREDARRF